ncbi:MAG: hypothetical protein L7W43_13395 [Rubripirellula sp.]|nr:hypothetical protein [Rubripirellula sp.]
MIRSFMLPPPTQPTNTRLPSRSSVRSSLPPLKREPSDALAPVMDAKSQGTGIAGDWHRRGLASARSLSHGKTKIRGTTSETNDTDPLGSLSGRSREQRQI